MLTATFSVWWDYESYYFLLLQLTFSKFSVINMYYFNNQEDNSRVQVEELALGRKLSFYLRQKRRKNKSA